MIGNWLRNIVETINQGYPGDLLSKRRQKFREEIQRHKNTRTGGQCIVWFFALVIIVLCILFLLYLQSQGIA